MHTASGALADLNLLVAKMEHYAVMYEYTSWVKAIERNIILPPWGESKLLKQVIQFPNPDQANSQSLFSSFLPSLCMLEVQVTHQPVHNCTLSHWRWICWRTRGHGFLYDICSLLLR